MPVGTAKFDLNRCNESPLRGEKPDFWPVSKNNTGSLPLRAAILPVIMRKHNICDIFLETENAVSGCNNDGIAKMQDAGLIDL